MPIEKFVSRSEKETMDVAVSVGKNSEAGDIICLKGDLGAGKTHFVKGFVRAFGIEPGSVTSPTFSLIHEYTGRLPVYHFDFYRIENPKEALEIGAEEYFYGEGVSIIEWPERIESLLPEHVIWIHITSTNSTTRNIDITRQM